MITPEWRPLFLLGLRPTGDLGPLTSYTSKRRKTVWFTKAPPTKPPTVYQIAQRNKFRIAAMAWQGMDDAARLQWSLAEQRGKLNITGYNLFIWYCLGGDPAVIRTIQRQTDTRLIS